VSELPIDSSNSWAESAAGLAGIGLWYWNIQKQEFTRAPGFPSLFGWPPEKGPQSPEAYLEIIHPNDRQTVIDTMREAREGKDVFHYRVRAIGRDSATYWVEIFGQVVRNAEGEAVGIRGATHDVTAQVGFERELSQTHSAYQKAIACGDMAVYHYNFLADRYDDSNIALMEQMLGEPYRGSHNEWWRRIQVTELHLLGDLANRELRDAIHMFQAGEVPTWRAEMRIKKSDGQTRWIYDNSYMMHDESGNPVGSFGILQDITELKLLSTTVEKIVEATGGPGEDYLRQLVIALSQALNVRCAVIGEILPSDPDYVTTVALALHGEGQEGIRYAVEGTPCEHVFRDGRLYIASQCCAQFPTDFLKCLGAEAYLGLRLTSKSGEIIGVMSVIDDGPLDESLDPERVLKLFASHAAAELERRKNEKATIASENLYRSLFSVQSEGILVLDENSQILTCNQSSERILRASREELAGKLEYDQPFQLINIDGSAWDVETAPSTLAIRTGQPQVGRICGLKFDDGTTTWISVNANPILDSEQSSARVVVSFADVTERLAVQQELERLNSELEHAVADRTDELQRANRELESFAYSVSHDLRQPLRAIDGFSRILEMDYADKLDEEGIETIATIRNATRRMSNLIDDMLRLSRLISHEVEWEDIDFTALAHEVLGTISQSLSDKPAEFTVAPNMRLRADRSLLRAVLDNLLQNAVKFSSKKASVHISVGHENGAFFVKDQGEGFDMQYSNKLFEPFQRLHSPREFEGSGIGLATVRRIIERHRGKVWAEAEVGKGATIYFSLPE
jgi:PAS domain S-box-containing protein